MHPIFSPLHVNSLERRRRDTSFKNEIFPLSSYLPLTTPRCQGASDLFLIFLQRKTFPRHEYSNQASILDFASESALQNGEAHDACAGHALILILPPKLVGSHVSVPWTFFECWALIGAILA